MDLFVVNRYNGDEPPLKLKSTENHLSELLKRIEERKGQKATVTFNNNESNPEKSTETQTQDNALQKKNSKRKVSRIESVPSESFATPIEKLLENTKEITNNNNANDNNNSESKQQDFLILGAGSKKLKKSVKRVLPTWLANPEIISAELSSGPCLDMLSKEDLDTEAIEILRANGIERLFPVQSSIVQWLSECNRDRKLGWRPRDTCVSAPTGSGKTLAYVLPIIKQLRNCFFPKIRCLVVLPVQELAAQVFKVFLAYSAYTNLKVALVSGASSFEMEQNNLIKKSKRGHFVSKVDIIIATPGRLIDHIEKTKGFSLESLEFLIIDEADRTTNWLRYIPQIHSCAFSLTLGNTHLSVRAPVQKLLFSATLSQDPEKLSRLGLFQPKLFTSVVVSNRDDDVNLDKVIHDFVGRYTSPNELLERAVQCDAEYKPLALYHLLTAKQPVEKTLVFTNSGITAHRLALLLRSLLTERSVIIDVLSAQLTPKQRVDVLDKFVKGSIHVLVSSDALARGLDIPGVKFVIGYDLPKHIKGYIHRSGRTGRAGTTGTAISLLTANQSGAFIRLLSSAQKSVPEIEILGSLCHLADQIDYQGHLGKLKNFLVKEQNDFSEKIKSIKRRHETKAN